MTEKETDLVVRRRGGGSVIECCPVFSSDSETLYVVWRSVIRAYRVKTGELVGEYEGLRSNAIGVHLHPTNSNAIVACSDRGDLIQWDWRLKLPGGSVRLKYWVAHDYDSVVTRFFLLPSGKQESAENSCNVCVVYKLKEWQILKVAICCSQTGNLIHTLPFKLDQHQHCIALGGRLGQQYLAGIFGNTLQYCDTVVWKNSDKQHIGNDRTFTSVACHPELLCIAAGDNSGRILLFWNVLSSGNPKRCIYHWHTLPCPAIVFSHAGTQFFSGGGEAVLVKWTVHTTIHKDFLPRLPAEICHLAMAPENKYLAICTVDNGIRIVDPQMKLCSVIQHFTWSPEKNFPAGIVFDPRSKSLVMNGITGHIQFYSPRTKSLIYNLDITRMNILTQERHTKIVNTDVVKIAFNIDGQWMATVEHRDDGESSVEVRLKFWLFDDVRQAFCLNTSVEQPHNGSVISLAFQPVQDPLMQLLVTTASDFKFRTWSLVESTRKGSLVWACESVGFYRNLPVGDVSFSMDGSLLAVAFGPTLTVWVSETNQLKCSLTAAGSSEHIRQVEFCQAGCYHLIVICTANRLYVWNLLTLKLLWTVSLHVSILCADPHSEFMAVFTRNNDLFVFSPRSSKPIYSHKNVVSSRKGKIMCAAFIPHSDAEKFHNIPWQENSQLYFLNSDQELLVLDHVEDVNEKEGLVFPVSTVQAVTPFGSLLAKQKVSEVEKQWQDMDQQLGVPGATAIKELLNVPPHTMPPMNVMCGPFLRSLVASNRKSIQEKVPDSKEASDIEMETEDSGVDSDDESLDAATINKSKELCVSKYKTLVSYNPTDEVDSELCLAKVLKEKMDWAVSLKRSLK